MVSRRPIHDGVGAVIPAVFRHRNPRKAARARPRMISVAAVIVEVEPVGVSGAIARAMAITVDRASIQPTTYAHSFTTPRRVATRMIPASTE